MKQHLKSLLLTAAIITSPVLSDAQAQVAIEDGFDTKEETVLDAPGESGQVMLSLDDLKEIRRNDYRVTAETTKVTFILLGVLFAILLCTMTYILCKLYRIQMMLQSIQKNCEKMKEMEIEDAIAHNYHPETFQEKDPKEEMLPGFGEEKKNTEIRKMAAPYWIEEKNGVVIPLLDIVLDAKNASQKAKNWKDARTIIKSLNRRMFTRDEAYILLWQKEEINTILKEHNGDLMDSIYWTNECVPNGKRVWVANFSPNFSEYQLSLIMRTPTRGELIRGVRDL